eukprot:3380008-Pleurochrysis_carterae.AAC.1
MATLSPCDAMPLAGAMELAYGGDVPQEVPLQVALAALRLEWQPLEQTLGGAEAGDAGVAGARG